MFSGTTAVNHPTRTALERERQLRGLSREELAALAGLSPRTIYALEVEEVRAQRATRRVLALALDCNVAELFPVNDQRPATEPGAGTTSAGQGRYGAAV